LVQELIDDYFPSILMMYLTLKKKNDADYLLGGAEGDLLYYCSREKEIFSQTLS
jgi:hypothetical protein